MDISVKLKRLNGKDLTGRLKVLDESYIENILELQNEVERGIINKEWYSATSREEFCIQLTEKGKIIGCLLDDDTLIALGAYVEWGYEEENYGYDLGISDKKLLKVGQIEATLVHEEFRGNKLQKKICMELEKIAKSKGNEVIAATIHPDNIYSLNTFKELGYEIKLEKLKYGGLRRFILSKNI